MENSGAGSSIATKTRWRTPENFFPIVVDDFFSNPEELVKLGKSLPKARSKIKTIVGNRTISK